jgi:hydrogenase-4 component E
LVDPLLVLVLILNFFLLGTSRMRSLIGVSALQGMILGVLAIPVHSQVTWGSIFIAVATAVIKGFLIPGMLGRAMRDAHIRREVEPLIGFLPSLLLGALGTGLSLVFSKRLPLIASDASPSLLVPGCFATVLTGFLLLTTRRKAITQVVGYLVLENGVFIMGLALVETMPVLVELGVLLDLFVGIFVMGIIINHISREFSSLDTGKLSTLKE